MAVDEEWKRAVRGGILSGLAGGVALAIFTFTMNASAGDDVWGGLKMAALPFLGARALAPGFDSAAVLLGALGHLAVAVAWGLPFGVLWSGIHPRGTVALGALWGIGVYAVMLHAVLPALGLGATARELAGPTGLLQHLVYGYALGKSFRTFQPRALRIGGPARVRA